MSQGRVSGVFMLEACAGGFCGSLSGGHCRFRDYQACAENWLCLGHAALLLLLLLLLVLVLCAFLPVRGRRGLRPSWEQERAEFPYTGC